MIFKDEGLNNKLKVMFEEYFKNSKYYTGQNCNPKYETYRTVFSGWLQGFLCLLEIVDSETYYNDFIDLCFKSDGFCDELLSAERLR